jgi:hypothetical protein
MLPESSSMNMRLGLTEIGLLETSGEFAMSVAVAGTGTTANRAAAATIGTVNGHERMLIMLDPSDC